MNRLKYDIKHYIKTYEKLININVTKDKDSYREYKSLLYVKVNYMCDELIRYIKEDYYTLDFIKYIKEIDNITNKLKEKDLILYINNIIYDKTGYIINKEVDF